MRVFGLGISLMRWGMAPIAAGGGGEYGLFTWAAGGTFTPGDVLRAER
jgi:hypothetical protein